MIGRLKSILFGSLPNDATKYYDGTGNFSTPGSGASPWDSIITKSADQDVASVTLTNDNELLRAVLAGESWVFELDVVYSATDTTTDFVWDIACSSGSMQGQGYHRELNSADLANHNVVSLVASSSSTDITNGTRAAHAVRNFYARFEVTFSANCNFNFRFAGAAISSSEARCKAGSILRCKKLAG